MNRQNRLSGTSLGGEKARSSSPVAEGPQFGSAKDLSLLLSVNQSSNHSTQPTRSGNRTPGSNSQSRNSGGSYLSSSSPKNHQHSGSVNFSTNAPPNLPTSQQTFNLFDKGHDPVLWASRLELREKGHFTLQEFSTLAKEASSSADVSEDIFRVAKAFAQLETNIKNTANTLTRMKASVADVHQSNEGILEALKTLPSIADGLSIEDLVKPLPPAPAPGATLTKSPPF